MEQVRTASTGRPLMADSCPGALRPHHAADGELLRVRVPGGALAPSALLAMAACAQEFGDGRTGLTSRGNVQLRGVAVSAVPAVVSRLASAGLLPSSSHERVRNVVASPLSGRGARARGDVDPLVLALDEALRARPELAELPGRFLFALDDGSGDVAAEGADVLARAVGKGWLVSLPGSEAGVLVRTGEVVPTMLAMAGHFLTERAAWAERALSLHAFEDGVPPRVWRVAELPGGASRILARMTAAGHRLAPAPSSPAGEVIAPGLLEQTDARFAVCALAPLGILDAEQARALAAACDLVTDSSPTDGMAGGGGEPATTSPPDALRVTPWRRVVVRDLELPAALAVRELLAAVGLVTESGTAWSRVTACAGRPGCAKSLTDVHEDARAFAAAADPQGPAVHFAGCERGCGSPSRAGAFRVLATPDGYRLHGGPEGAPDTAAGARDTAAGGAGTAGRAVSLPDPRDARAFSAVGVRR